ncbi:MAG: aldehyde dehydrogenase family protein [Rhodospirillaceae bacterium]|nr:aldehyde dehydrogenase family protein [Rhodospirillaceae bacterium]MBT7249948.1 aldehyde dehydrogenase family protein [Rhodospirillaceae bacterium]
MDASTSPDLGFTPKGLYIGGEWQDAADGRTFASTNPSNGEHLGDVPLAGEVDVDRAVAAAKTAFTDWGRAPVKERAQALNAFADKLVAHKEELALMDSVDSGNTLAGMQGDVDWTAATLKFFAGLITEIKGETSSQQAGHLNMTMRQPYGVVAKINAFNHPFRFCAEKAAAALAAGNTVVAKASEQAPLSSLRLAELSKGILPPGVFNVVTGDGATGSAMVRHPDVPRVGFVGSVETGRLIARDAAEGLKHVTLELGGKNPIIIFPDADPVKAATAAIKGMNMNRQGQSCSSTSRVFVHQNLQNAVNEELVKQAEALPIGMPWVDGNEVGPVVSDKQLERVKGFIASAPEDGAALLTGGGVPTDPALANGHFIEPTVFGNVTPEMRIGHQEIFGPVMSVLAWDDYEDMLAKANGVMYGLTATIVTNDFKMAMETAERIEAGYVWVNAQGRYLGAPYGGWKQSGLGQEECLDELLSYTQIKNINMRW